MKKGEDKAVGIQGQNVLLASPLRDILSREARRESGNGVAVAKMPHYFLGYSVFGYSYSSMP